MSRVGTNPATTPPTQQQRGYSSHPATTPIIVIGVNDMGVGWYTYLNSVDKGQGWQGD